MLSTRRCLASMSVALLTLGVLASAAMLPAAAVASEIKLIVNNIPVTSYDIQRRTAFLRLQRRKGNLASEAQEDMLVQALHNDEAKRLNVSIKDDAVDDAYIRFAKSNKMSTKQLDGIMNQSGVTTAHFKEYIRSQMAWNQVLSLRGRRSANTMTDQDVAQRMLKQGGAKPTATEYMLQQVIFVVPANDRGSMAKRKREADAMRARFSGCDRTREFAKGLIDVTVKDLGRKFGPELPPDWAEQIKQTKVGGATAVRETPVGLEFIGICSSREVSDDRVAKMVFQAEGKGDGKDDDLSKTYTEELRKKAKIVNR